MIKHLRFTYKDVYNLPVWKRRWFLEKFASDLENQKKSDLKTQSPINSSTNNSKRIFK
jgi:hypothetical protein